MKISKTANVMMGGVNTQYTFSNGIVLSIGAGGRYYSEPRGEGPTDWEKYNKVELAILRDGEFISPKGICLPQFDELFAGDDVAGYVNVATVKAIIEICKQKFEESK